MARTILIIENSGDLECQLKKILVPSLYVLFFSKDIFPFLKKIKMNEIDLILIDIDSVKSNHSVLFNRIKKINNTIPIIILTRIDSINEIIHALHLGVEDYIIKPIIVEQFLARITARLSKKQEDLILVIADLICNVAKMDVKRAGKTISLSPQEFKLFHYLLINKEKIVTREMILSEIWNYATDVETRVVDVYIGYLRKKIDKGFSKKLIHSIRGAGYMIKDD